MNSKEKKNYNQFYLDMLNLIEQHVEKVPPHEVGFSLISAATTMMLQNSNDPLGILKLCYKAVNSGVEEFEEEDAKTPILWDKDED